MALFSRKTGEYSPLRQKVKLEVAVTSENQLPQIPKANHQIDRRMTRTEMLMQAGTWIKPQKGMLKVWIKGVRRKRQKLSGNVVEGDAVVDAFHCSFG